LDSFPGLLYSTPEGRLETHPELQALVRSGWDELPAVRLIPLPPQSTLVHLPCRIAVGRDRQGRRVSLESDGGLAVAAVPPLGYLRTWLPAYEERQPAPVLPLFGYAAVAAVNGKPYVAALRTDSWDAWDADDPHRKEIQRHIKRAAQALPDNRLVAHLAICATEYRCLTAQNIFLRQGEGAIPVSPACNAACLGCISEQWGDVPSPQVRLAFAPSAIEIAELAGWHLAGAEHNFVSFGQGCEGEALTRGQALVEATRRIRAAAPDATIHINTNASRPDVLKRLLKAGLNSARISIFSLDEQRFKAYYRPAGYSLEQVRACADLLKEHDAQVTVNLLTFPGISDSPDEIDALVEFVQAHGVHQVQLRSLNIDPLWLLRQIPNPTRGTGMEAFVQQLRDRCPSLRLGNFTRPRPVGLIQTEASWASSR
jgi:pyruvate-formate lyase-activating enzyme